MSELVMSRYCRVIERPGDAAVYHRLFGNLTLLTSGQLDVLRSFQRPRRPSASDDPTLVRELTARSFLAASGLDERDRVKEDASRREARLDSGYLVRGLQLVVSNDCNFKCKYCFVNNMYGSEERKWFQTDEQNRIMSLETACAAMDRTLEIVRRNGHSELFVEFFGGEPLTNWPLVRSVLERYPSAGATGPGVRYSITTNGSLVTEEMAEVLARHGVTVTVSFDSPKNTDRLPVSGGGARRLIQDAITRLRRHENWVTFNSVLSKQTIDTFDGRSLVDFAVEHGVKMIGLILDLDLAFYADPGNRAKAVAAIMDTYQYGVSRGLPIVGYWHQIFAQIVGLHSLNLQKGFKTCPAEGCKVSVEPAGHVFICKCCSGHLGHVDRLEDVFRTPAYRDYAMKAYLNDPSCAGCDLENFCSGVCMGALEKRYRSVFGRETSSCQVFRELLEALIHTVRNPNAS